VRDAFGREQMVADRGQDLCAREILAHAPIVAAQTLLLVGLVDLEKPTVPGSSAICGSITIRVAEGHAFEESDLSTSPY
jgi:hypothetical protein